MFWLTVVATLGTTVQPVRPLIPGSQEPAPDPSLLILACVALGFAIVAFSYWLCPPAKRHRRNQGTW